MFVQDGLLGGSAQLSEDGLAAAGGGGSLAVNINILVSHIGISYRIFTHCVLRVLTTVGLIAGTSCCCFRTS